MAGTRPRRRRFSTLRLLRVLWRYRRRIEGHGDRYQVEVATAVKSAIDQRLLGRIALVGYRFAMRLLVAGAIVFVVLTLLAAVLVWQIADSWWGLSAGLLPLIPAVLFVVWRFTYGGPLDWLDEHADPDRTVPLKELPARLREIARELRDIADVPANIARELDELADEAERRGPHVVG